MEAQKKHKKSIWGNWWVPIRKWFYPAWLIYEVTVRFYVYTLAIHQYFKNGDHNIASYIGEIGAQVLDILSSSITFIGCTAFLTIPSCYILYKFFEFDNLTNTRFEQRIKVFF